MSAIPNPLFVALLMTRRRLSHQEIILHPTRRAILRLARENPGITVGNARARLAIPLGTFYHHLLLLRRNDLIDAHLVGRRCTLYLPGASSAMDAAARSLLRGDAIREIARAIVRYPGGSVADAVERTGKPMRTAYHHIERLVEAGLVTSGSPTRRFDLRPSDRLLRILDEFAD